MRRQREYGTCSRRIGAPVAVKKRCSWSIRPARRRRSGVPIGARARRPRVARARAPVVAGLGDILVHPRDARLRNTQRSARGVVVRNAECDLLGRPEPGEEPELIIVALRLAPIPMERCKEPLGFLDAEGINYRPVFLADAGALEGYGGIAPLGAIAIAELERAPQCTDSVVVCLWTKRRDWHCLF